MSRILIIEDDPDIVASLQHALEREGGHEVTVAERGEAGLAEARRRQPDLVLLDLNLPGISGLDVCRSLREGSTARVPIIMLTARVQEHDRIRGLDLGADDYISKPFSLKELLARVRAVLRRSSERSTSGGSLCFGNVLVDEACRQVRVGDRAVPLTRMEFDLLAELVRQRGRVLGRDRLLERVWGYDHPGATRTVDVHIRQIRRKLGEPSAGYIETVVGVGYRCRVED